MSRWRSLRVERLGLTGRARVLLSKGCWFDSRGLPAKESFGKLLNPKCAPDVLAPCMTTITVGQKCLINAVNVNVVLCEIQTVHLRCGGPKVSLITFSH